jgi:hypothetical protein
MPRQLSFVAGSGCEESLFLQLPGSAFKAHLAPKGSPTALVKIVGEPVQAVEIEKLLARICHLSSQWKWEAIPHGADAFLVSFPSADDLKRMDGMQMGVPSSTSQMTITAWQVQDVQHKHELQKVWVHVDGVPHTVRHFLGLWATASLIGTPVDVDLVTLRSRGVVRLRVAMMDPKNLQQRVDKQGRYCLRVMVGWWLSILRSMIFCSARSSRILCQMLLLFLTFGVVKEMIRAMMVMDSQKTRILIQGLRIRMPLLRITWMWTLLSHHLPLLHRMGRVLQLVLGITMLPSMLLLLSTPIRRLPRRLRLLTGLVLFLLA